MIISENYLPAVLSGEEWEHNKCDKYDYIIAAFCGCAAGMIDVFFVGDPAASRLGGAVDNAADGLVKKAAQLFWRNDKRKTGRSRQMPQTLEQCISYLEQAFPVPYDARYGADLAKDGVLPNMRPANHHLLSLAHSPDPIGLIFSIIDQFNVSGTFIDRGKLIHVAPKKPSKAIPYLQGTNFPSKIFCGFVNWIGHLLSDLAGSSSTRKEDKTGRGAGIPLPFYSLFLGCNFGPEDGKTVAETMIKVFEEGYDARFGVAMAIPVLLQELMIKCIWILRQRFERKKPWSECLPTAKHADLRIMLIVGNGTLCAVDGVDAAARGLGSKNVVTFICHLNMAGWSRLVMLVLKELSIRLGPVVRQELDQFTQAIMEALPTERKAIAAFHAQLEAYDLQLQTVYFEFVEQVEREYAELKLRIDQTFDESLPLAQRAACSAELARAAGVDEGEIVNSRSQLDEMFGHRR